MDYTAEQVCEELGKLFMENVVLRRALGDQQRETARMATEVGSLRQRHQELSAVAIEQEENLIALNEQLMGKANPREIKHD